ncbi:MAG: hypothetical protein ACREPM_04905 [Gemmatimonadaceae bacterium]
MTSDWPTRLLRAWLITAVSDAIFSSALVKFAYGSSVTRLWQGVASVPLGPSALEGGTRTMLIGLALHACVAFTWTAVFLVLYSSVGWLRAVTSSWTGVIGTGVVYGPLIWMIMSFVVIQSFTHRPPAINFRWWVQWFGHIPAVALPIVASISSRRATAAVPVRALA